MTDERCTETLGTKPWWMSPDQYDPCRCWLAAGHEGDHQCDHTNPEFDGDWTTS